MKTILLERGPLESIPLFPTATLIPDSALTRPGLPLFLPDFARSWTGRLYLALRVSRLGKGIALRFAPRYYDAASLILRLIPEPAGEFAGALAAAFDGCIQLGQWHEADLLRGAAIGITCGDRSCTLTPDEAAADAAIEAVSRYLTIRNGDIIAPVAIPCEIPAVKRGDIIEATLCGLPLLRARIK